MNFPFANPTIQSASFKMIKNLYTNFFECKCSIDFLSYWEILSTAFFQFRLFWSLFQVIEKSLYVLFLFNFQLLLSSRMIINRVLFSLMYIFFNYFLNDWILYKSLWLFFFTEWSNICLYYSSNIQNLVCLDRKLNDSLNI